MSDRSGIPPKRPGWVDEVKAKPKGVGGGQSKSTEQKALMLIKRRPEMSDRRVAKVSGLALARVKELRGK